MSKIKMSFSLILTFILVGILSTAVFAHSAYTWSVKAVTSGANKGGFSVSVTPLNNETGFTIATYTKNAATGAVTATGHTYQVNTPDGSGNFTGSIPAADVTVGQEYQVSLFNLSGSLLQDKLVVITPQEIGMATVTSPKTAPSTNPVITNSVTVDANGSGLANSNHTGADSAKHSGQGTHGFYQNNTNSCAVCHQTHTSDDATGNLLMKNGAYSTCTSCHDGTTGGYNAFQPSSAATTASIDGTFDVTMDGTSGTHNGSMHVSDGSLKVSAAPGGSGTASGPFASNFDCTSCHNPHGGGSAGENNLNQDPLGWGSVPYASTPGTNVTFHGTTKASTTDNEYGKMYVNPTIYTPSTIPSSGAPYIFVLNTAGVDLSTLSTTSAEYYYLSNNGYTSNTPILLTYRFQKGGYTPDFSMWLQEKGYPFKADTALYNDVWTNLNLTSADNYWDATKDITRASNVTVIWKAGFAYGDGVKNVQSIQVSLGVDVPTTQYIQSLYQVGFSQQETNGDGSLKVDKNNNPVMDTYIPDSGVDMSKFCASCHTDYLSTTRTVNTGVYTVAHRHMTLADETNCIRCHYAHGSDATIMHDANDNTQFTTTDPVTGGTFAHTGDLAYFKDPNPSSALKRYTGMSVCYACHGQGEQFLSNPNNVDRPLFGQPGTTTRNVDPTKAGE